MCTMIYKKKVHGIIVWNSKQIESVEMFIVTAILWSNVQLLEQRKWPLMTWHGKTSKVSKGKTVEQFIASLYVKC